MNYIECLPENTKWKNYRKQYMLPFVYETKENIKIDTYMPIFTKRNTRKRDQKTVTLVTYKG